jgi:RNA polymerase primary sigma factor
LDVSEDEIRITLSVSNRHVSADAAFAHNEDMSMMDVLTNPDEPQPDNKMIALSLNTEVKRALSSLSQRESEIITLFYGIGFTHAFTLEEIGIKYDLTRERVRQIKEKAIKRLRHTSKSKILRTYLG